MKRAAPVLAVLALAGMISVDAAWPVARRAPEEAAPYAGAGVLACPMAVLPNARSFLHVANFGETDASLRISVVPERGKPEILQQTLPGGRARNVRLNGRVKGAASAVVEHTGGRVAASHTMWFPRRRQRGPRVLVPRGAVGATCRAAGPGASILPHLGTSRGREVRLTLYNPGAADADVSIALHAGRQVLRPERLDRRVIPPRRFRTFDLEDFAFDVDELAAVVTANAGRVVAEAMLIAPGGVTLIEGDPVRRDLVVLSGASGKPATTGLVGVGESDTGVEGSLIGLTSQGRAARIPTDLRPGSTALVKTPSTGERGPIGYDLTVTVGDPIGVAASWAVERRGVDKAAVGSTVPATRWIAVAGSPVERATIRAVILNPGSTPARVTVRRLRGDTDQIVIEPGRVARVPVGAGKGAFGVGVEADVPVAVMLEGIGSEVVDRLSSTYGFGLYGAPVDDPMPVPVGIDPRAGVAAPLLGRDQ